MRQDLSPVKKSVHPTMAYGVGAMLEGFYTLLEFSQSP